MELSKGEIYKPERDGNGDWYVDGSGVPGYYRRKLRFKTEDEVNIACILCNLVYKTTVDETKREIRKVLGL